METWIIDHWPILSIAGLLFISFALLPLYSINDQIRESNRYLQDISAQLSEASEHLDRIESHTLDCIPDKVEEEEDLYA